MFCSDFALNPEQQALLDSIPTHYFEEAVQFIDTRGCNYAGLITHLKSTLQIKGKDLFMPLRIALTGEQHGPELAKIMELLGSDEVRRRLLFNTNEAKRLPHANL